jgi:hypothetical protein
MSPIRLANILVTSVPEGSASEAIARASLASWAETGGRSESIMNSREEPLAEHLLTILESVLEPRSAAYAAGPVTGGRIAYTAEAPLEPAEVRRRNRRALTEFCVALRKRLSIPVIDPGVLYVPEWTNAQYNSFFLKVLERYGREAWFLDGWEYSRGATGEYVWAVEHNRPCFNAVGKPLLPEDAAQALAEAGQRLRQLGLPRQWVDRRISALKSVACK